MDGPGTFSLEVQWIEKTRRDVTQPSTVKTAAIRLITLEAVVERVLKICTQLRVLLQYYITQLQVKVLVLEKYKVFFSKTT